MNPFVVHFLNADNETVARYKTSTDYNDACKQNVWRYERFVWRTMQDSKRDLLWNDFKLLSKLFTFEANVWILIHWMSFIGLKFFDQNHTSRLPNAKRTHLMRCWCLMKEWQWKNNVHSISILRSKTHQIHVHTMVADRKENGAILI